MQRSSYIRFFALLISGIASHVLMAQYAPQVGIVGSTAIAADSSIIVGWATGCTVQRGYRDIAVHDSGYATYGTATDALGAADGLSVVSLGDGGTATLTFGSVISDHVGYDFAVFENGFATGAGGLAFLELAFVEVSSDGVNFVRFPAISHTSDTTQLSLVGMDCSRLHNLAGKYTSGFGTPFDLHELADSTAIDIHHITHIRVRDVVGSINPSFGSRDHEGHLINDPYPTNFASSGFDLDGVAILGVAKATGIADNTGTKQCVAYPNPCHDKLHLNLPTNADVQISLYDIQGSYITTIDSRLIDMTDMEKGIYVLRFFTSDYFTTIKVVKE